MATKLKSDVWSIIALIAAVLSLIYCGSFIAQFIFDSSAAELLASLRRRAEGDL